MGNIKDATTKVVHNGERVVNNGQPEQSAIAYCEEMYPQTCEEFKNILDEMYVTFCKKQRNYGPGNISVGTPLETKDDVKLSLTGLWFRINDKVQRLKQLVVLGQPDEVGESIQDTYEDLSVYGVIAQIVSRKKWGK
jgi:hypothetical protein